MWQAGGKALKLAHCAMDKRLRIFQAFGHKRLPAGSALECGPALRDRTPKPTVCRCSTHKRTGGKRKRIIQN
jgi:hypothetical protein